MLPTFVKLPEYDASVGQAEKARKSYVATRLGPVDRLAEVRSLYRGNTWDVARRVSALLDEAAHFCDVIAQLRGAPVEGLEIVEIGPGQQLVQLAYFAARNSVTGIDTDLLAPRLGPRDVAAMIHSNGALRTAKTVVRKLSGIDRRGRAELLSQLGLSAMPPLRLAQMDAAAMTFGDESIDAVYSRAVFEHLTDPAGVIREIRRVLRPGGVMCVRLHLYASDSGVHDARIFTGQRDGVPFWSHLRPPHQHLVHPNTYLNKLRLAEWRHLFSDGLPGSVLLALMDAPARERDALRQLRATGELGDYSDEELLSPTVEVTWRKPAVR